MEVRRLLTELESDSARFHSFAIGGLAGGLDPDVPHCPGWRLSELVTHLASIHELVARWIDEGRRPDQWQREPAEGQTLQEYARAATDRMLDAVCTVDPLTPCSTWSPYDQTIGFWVRRMAHETAVHRVDAQQALGLPWDVDPLVAADGIDEALSLWLGTRMPPGMLGSGEAVRVQAYGGEDETLFDRVVRPHGEMLHYSPYAPVDHVRHVIGGPVASVWAWVWGRSDADHEVSGEAAELRAILAAAQQ